MSADDNFDDDAAGDCDDCDDCDADCTLWLVGFEFFCWSCEVYCRMFRVGHQHDGRYGSLVTIFLVFFA